MATKKRASRKTTINRRKAPKTRAAHEEIAKTCLKTREAILELQSVTAKHRIGKYYTSTLADCAAKIESFRSKLDDEYFNALASANDVPLNDVTNEPSPYYPVREAAR